MKPKGPGICHIASHVEMKKMSGLLCKMLTAYFITVNSGAKALTTNDFFSYGTAAGDTLFLTSNDYFTRASDDLLSNVAYSIYKRPHRNIIISSNGVITLSRLSGLNYTRRTFENVYIGQRRTEFSSVFLFYANVDISGSGGGGKIYYRLTDDNMFLQTLDQKIHELCVYESDFRSSSAVVATWVDVGYYYRKTNLRNTFQCVLVSNGTSTFVFFLYANIRWTRADSPYNQYVTQVGFDFGDQQSTYRLPNTTTDAGVKNLMNTSNAGMDGMWAFKLSHSYTEVAPIRCAQGTVTLSPRMIVLDGVSDSKEFTCNLPGGSPKPTWHLNGTIWEDGTTFSGIQATVSADGKKIQFQRISKAANGTEIYCRVSDRFNQNSFMVSNKGMIYLKGPLGAVSDLNVVFICPSFFEISWSALADITPRDSYCVSIIDTYQGSSDVKHMSCGIKATTYSYTANSGVDIDCKHIHNVSVYAVNSAGNGKRAMLFVVGSEVPAASNTPSQDSSVGSVDSKDPASTREIKVTAISKGNTGLSLVRNISVALVGGVVIIASIAMVIGVVVYKAKTRKRSSSSKPGQTVSYSYTYSDSHSIYDRTASYTYTDTSSWTYNYSNTDH